MMGKNKKGVNKKNTDRNTVLHGGERRERREREGRGKKNEPYTTTNNTTEHQIFHVIHII